jgi:hypothetical protein
LTIDRGEEVGHVDIERRADRDQRADRRAGLAALDRLSIDIDRPVASASAGQHAFIVRTSRMRIVPISAIASRCCRRAVFGVPASPRQIPVWKARAV